MKWVRDLACIVEDGWCGYRGSVIFAVLSLYSWIYGVMFVEIICTCTLSL